jgi:hypothetical protein
VATSQTDASTSPDPAAKRGRHTLPGGEAFSGDVVWQELSAAFSWYSHAADRARILHQGLKLLSLLLAAVVTVLAASNAPARITASIAAGIVVIEGIQQLFKFHTNWLRYRVVTETLRVHGFLYVAHLAPYDGDGPTARSRLGHLLSSVLEDERKQWAVHMKPPDTQAP